MSKMVMIAIGFSLFFFLSLGASKIREEIAPGNDVHSEIFRLRGDIASIRNILIISNGLLAAIIAALIF